MAVKRAVKGVKLNVSDELITFEDVAGISEAKVRLLASGGACMQQARQQ